jgi:hypothetical protein
VGDYDAHGELNAPVAGRRKHGTTR